ncbi:ankyrin repeat domain-containing protein SOWAHB-like [Brienomyrus brachyistius]|uniref:ankyrin repeat domain-containing protein SOWAHB-like n=1 Tax=Brienomyrus brachyistius TaxID=42636 RepID=UPI0020B1E75E|nr:ankyrin repeat domain-containing protein SOWAHB-like [Brienomyrus brachyistius]
MFLTSGAASFLVPPVAMASELSQDAVLQFILSKNGRVRNADLLTHFRTFLRENDEKTQNREFFKKFVNSVAVVKQEEGVSFVVLKKRYMVHVGDAVPAPKAYREKHKQAKQTGFSPQEENGNLEKGQASPQTKFKLKTQPVSRLEGFNALPSTNNILPSAGIITNVEGKRDTNPPLSTLHTSITKTDRVTENRSCTLKLPEAKVVYGVEKPQDNVSDKTSVAPANTERIHASIAKPRPSEPLPKQKATFSQNHPYSSSNISPDVPAKPNVLEKVEKEIKRQEFSSSVCPLTVTTRNISQSSSCILSCHKDSDNTGATPSHESQPAPLEILESTRSHQQEDGVAAEMNPHLSYHSLPPESPGSSVDSYSDMYRTGLSASHGDLLSPSYGNSEWPERFHKDQDWASDESLNFKGLSSGKRRVFEMLHRALEPKLALLHRAERKVTPYHHSTGYLDDVPREGQSGSESGHPVPLHTMNRKSSEFRNRMCRSLGADLDQPFHDDVVSARKNRLYLLSSSLSMSYLSRPSHLSRSGNVACPDHKVSTSESAYFHRNTLVPLESKEHDWLVKAASGCWTEIYSLFREDPSLLNKRDFISGFTVLHWIAKHGDHRVLNTLWYGVSKAGLNFDIDSKTTCGYTPLHLAVIHGHRKLIRLLVHKFKAKVSLRDTSGKKAWQYLGLNSSRDLLELLGAPKSKTAHGKIFGYSSEKLLIQPNSTCPSVKRQTSIAAILKHKSLLKIHAHSESSV